MYSVSPLQLATGAFVVYSKLSHFMPKINLKNNYILILPDIRSAINVGSMLRTADAVGIHKVYMTGYTPVPIDKYGRKRKDIAKASLGAEDSVPWEYTKSTSALINRLKKEGYFVVAIEQHSNSVNYKSIKKNTKMAFLMGNETEGLPKSILTKCDAVAEIEMKGKKESLNVAVACGVALFRIIG